MCTREIHISIKIPKMMRQNWLYKSFWTKEKRGLGTLGFKCENRQSIGSWGRAEHSVFALQLGNNGIGGNLAS